MFSFSRKAAKSKVVTLPLSAASMDDPDLLSLGQHCSVSECRSASPAYEMLSDALFRARMYFLLSFLNRRAQGSTFESNLLGHHQKCEKSSHVTLLLNSGNSCRQRDFLPFTCDCCKQVYCLEHRTYSGHNCQKAETNATTTILCPLCARAIKIGPKQNPNIVFEEHTAQVSLSASNVVAAESCKTLESSKCTGCELPPMKL